MMDPEYYIGAFKQPGSNWQTTKYSDNSCELVSPNAETVRLGPQAAVLHESAWPV